MSITYDSTANFQTLTVVDLITSSDIETGTVSLEPSSDSTPSLTFVGDLTTGIAGNGAGQLTIVSGSSDIADFNSGGVFLHRNLDMGGNYILNTLQNAANNSVATKGYVDSIGSMFTSANGIPTTTGTSYFPVFFKMQGTTVNSSNTPGDWSMPLNGRLMYVNSGIPRSVTATLSMSVQTPIGYNVAVVVALFKNGVIIPQSQQRMFFSPVLSLSCSIPISVSVPVGLVNGDYLEVFVANTDPDITSMTVLYMSLTCK